MVPRSMMLSVVVACMLVLNQGGASAQAPGTIVTVAGGDVGDGRPATQAAVNPDQIVLDASGDLFISEPGSDRIRKVSPQGIITTVAGTGGQGFSGDGGPATQAQISNSTGVAAAAAGNLLITGYQRIRKVVGVAASGLVAGQPLPGSIGTLHLDDAISRPGQTVDLSLEADSNLRQLTGARITLETGSFLHLDPSSLAIGPLISGPGAASSVDGTTPGQVTRGLAGALPHDGPGLLATLSAKIDASTRPGMYPLTLANVSAFGPGGQPLPVRSFSGTMVVLGKAGDVDSDGKVDIGDAMLVLRYVVGLTTLTSAQMSAADANGDRVVNLEDATLILRMAVGLP